MGQCLEGPPRNPLRVMFRTVSALSNLHAQVPTASGLTALSSLLALRKLCRIRANWKDLKMRFENKVVIITGGSGKIAKAYAMAFAKEGAKVSLPDVASADPIVRAIKDMGGTAISMSCDVS